MSKISKKFNRNHVDTTVVLCVQFFELHLFYVQSAQNPKIEIRFTLENLEKCNKKIEKNSKSKIFLRKV